jgi:DNA-binding transcriptional LysR family regulator
MNIRFLETFVWLHRLKSFSRVAEKLHTTQPAISGRMQKLETLLGVQLYERSSKSFELTAAGRRILRHSEHIVALDSEMKGMIAADQATARPLHIGLIEIVTLSWLPRYLQRIRAVAPSAVLEIGTGTTDQLVGELKEGRLDLIFVMGPINEPHLENRPICSFTCGWMANPQHFDCSRSMDVLELSRLPVMMGRKGSSAYAQTREYFSRYGVLDVPNQDDNIRLDCVYSVSTALKLIRDGLGVMSMPLFLFAEDIASGTIAPLQLRQPMSPFHLTACYRQPAPFAFVETLANLASEAAAEFIRECPPGHFWT